MNFSARFFFLYHNECEGLQIAGTEFLSNLTAALAVPLCAAYFM